jgi:lipopolysaccharide/colanic/teichoic acid biosynthesis glycosyltransferase
MQVDSVVITYEDTAISWRQRVAKRLIDISLGLILASLAAPLLAAVAYAIWLERDGPILFRQQRVGEGGRLFTMYKFRTMVPDAEQRQWEVGRPNETGTIIFKTADDPRVTRLGRLLRRTSLDELPQLWNVLRGDMSLVGPRPELPWLVAQYERWQYRRLAVPQGMTGLWQVSGRSQNPMHLFTQLDIQYVDHYSIWLDLYILIKTPLIVLRGIGAF